VLYVLLPALRVSLVTCMLCGIVYPLAVTGLAQLLLPDQANGSLLRSPDGVVIGSRLIGQDWRGPQWFHGRPSATAAADPHNPAKTIAAPYNAAASGGSNLGPTSRALVERLAADREALNAAQPQLAGRHLPSDMLTASGSGLDPDITPADAALQVPRIAEARDLSLAQVNVLVERDTVGRALGIFGEPRVNVLRLNLDLQNSFPPQAAPRGTDSAGLTR
jgi:potassium-transporting ATPase KdpC subunit